MKKSLARPRSFNSSGFTLVELLVVMGIIAILAAVVLSAGNTAIKAAQRAKAQNLATNIQTAALAYFADYSVYPVPTTATGDTIIGDSASADGSSWASLLYCLSGNIHPSTGLATPAPSTAISNTRGIAYLSLKSTDVYSAADATSNNNAVQDAPKNPIPSSTSSALYFNIAFDSDYSGVIGDPTSAVNQKIPNFAKWTSTTPDFSGTSTAGVIVWGNCNGSTTSNLANLYVKTY